MTESPRSAALGGVLYGVMAGALFLLAQVFAAMFVGESPWAPIQPFSSVVLGESAVGVRTSPQSVVVGFIVHFALSALYGAIYCAANARRSSKIRTGYVRQSALGLLYGAALWLINLELIARFFYPWLLESSQLIQLGLHAVTFGLPLALFYAGAQRREQPSAGRTIGPTAGGGYGTPW